MTAPVTPTGPFVVTHRRPVDAVDCGHPEAPKDGWPVYREAFATLEEMLSRVRTRVRETCAREFAGWPGIEGPDYLALREGSRTVVLDPLPNGDVIEVEATSCREISEQTPFRKRPSTRWPCAHLTATDYCAAWNAEHGTGIGVGR